MVGGGQGGINLPLPVPFNPGSHPVFVGSRLFAFFRLQNIVQCCIIFPFFSRFPPPWESRFPPPSSPASRRPPTPFSPGLPPPFPPHTQQASVSSALFVNEMRQPVHCADRHICHCHLNKLFSFQTEFVHNNLLPLSDLCLNLHPVDQRVFQGIYKFLKATQIVLNCKRDLHGIITH